MPGVDQTHVPTSFKWSRSWGNHICIAGSFDPPIPTWSPIEMPKNKDNVHEITLDLLPDKKYYFKFVVDGNWVLDEGFPSCPDSSGNWNHEIQVELPPPPPAEEKKEEHQEEHQEEHREEVIVEEEQIITEETKIEHHQEDQVITEKSEDHQEEHHHDHQDVAEDHKIEQQHQEDQVIDEVKEEKQLDHQVVTEDHQVDENKQEQEVVIEDKEEQVVEQQLQHQEEQVVSEDKEEQLQHQEEQVVIEEQVVSEEQVVIEEQVVSEDKEQQHQQHQEDNQVVEELNQHHYEDVQKEQHNEDQEINTTEQSHDDTVVTNVPTSEAIETETITNETMVEQPELSSIVKETIIESDNDKLSAEQNVANVIDDVIIEGTHDESMTTESNETLHTPQNDTEPINVSISPIVIDENVTSETAQHKVTETSETYLVNEFKVTEETSSSVGEKHETVEFLTTETEIPVENSTDEIKVVNFDEEIENETIKEDEDDYENEEIYEKSEGIENTIIENLEDSLSEETLKEVLLNNTWAKDDSLEDTIPSSWTESHESRSVIWPDDTNLEWSDINKETSDETAIPEKFETTNKPETEIEDVEETRVTEITSNDESNIKETTTGQADFIVEEISSQVVESHIEHKTEESDYEIGINDKVPTSEVKESVATDLSFAQYEKPESSATADKEMSSIPTTVVAAPAIEQHSHLDEEIVIPNAIDKSKEDVLKENISRKIISISPSTSSPGESTRNADMYIHNITVATNTSRSKETVNIKSKHKPVVEITSREILQKDSKIVIQHDDDEEKVDLNDIAYLVTSVATTFTLGIISMLYKSVFGTNDQ